MQFCVDKQRMHKFHLGFWQPLKHKEKSTWHFYQPSIAIFLQILILTELFLYDISIIDNNHNKRNKSIKVQQGKPKLLMKMLEPCGR